MPSSSTQTSSASCFLSASSTGWCAIPGSPNRWTASTADPTACRSGSAGGRGNPDEPELPAANQRRPSPCRRLLSQGCAAGPPAGALLVLRRRDYQQLPGSLLRCAAAQLADLCR